MSLAIVHTRASLGINAPAITVEVHISNGLPGLSIVGLPEATVKESKDRVRSAILNSQLEFPAKRITINLAPADIPKEGSRFDLPIALGILVASKQLPVEVLRESEFVGELALTGGLRSVSGILTAAIACAISQRRLFCAKANAIEASLCQDAELYGADSLLSLCAHLLGQSLIPQQHFIEPEQKSIEFDDINDVRGQSQAKRALTIAAAGKHNLLMFGPPGTGKTLLASRLPGLLPRLDADSALEVAAIYSLCHKPIPGGQMPPFRAPHHTASAVALVGGGSRPKPGEISLAHKGVLFLDELPEFSRHVLEVLREPLESGEIRISRAKSQCEFPADFQLIAAMNPCPCGYFGSQGQACRCSPAHIQRYRQKVSGPLLDRIDLHIGLQTVSASTLKKAPSGPNSDELRAQAEMALRVQLKRQGMSNSELPIKSLSEICSLTHAQDQLLETAMLKLNLSSRAYHRILRVARTLADLESTETIANHHITEALSLRQFDRQI